jgi:pimeloyl-[acyl-carrier protein] synthase
MNVSLANPVEGDNIEESNQENLSLLRLLNQQVLADPYPLYRALREQDPVHWDPYMHAWVVTGYAEVAAVLTSYSSDRAPALDYLDRHGLSFMKPFAEMMQQQMLFMDGAAHARLRTICAAAFTPRKVEELRTEIQSVADALIDKVTPSGSLDILADFAAPFPAIMTAKLMGVPVEDHRLLGAWVNDIAEWHGNFQHHPDRVAEIVQSLHEMKTYIADRMNELHEHPNDGLICSLMITEVDGQRLTDEEVIASTIVTIIGGHETITNLIASGFLSLLRNPKSLEHLREHPEIAVSAVEELLRYESPVQYTGRLAPADTELGGKRIRKGEKVVAVLAAANRDPNRFPDPDRLNLLRPDNRHLAFGWASHFCFGAPLARMQGQIALVTLLRRLSRPALLDKTVHWRLNAGLRGVTILNVRFDPGLPTATARPTYQGGRATLKPSAA